MGHYHGRPLRLLTKLGSVFTGTGATVNASRRNIRFSLTSQKEKKLVGGDVCEPVRECRKKIHPHEGDRFFHFRPFRLKSAAQPLVPDTGASLWGSEPWAASSVMIWKAHLIFLLASPGKER